MELKYHHWLLSPAKIRDLMILIDFDFQSLPSTLSPSRSLSFIFTIVIVIVRSTTGSCRQVHNYLSVYFYY